MLTISLKPSACGDWIVCHEGMALFGDLPLEQAIKLARVVASDEHQRVRGPTCVDMPGTQGQIVLARYSQLDVGRTNQSVAA